ncbi:MAG TPA: chromosome segregation protein SMC, partial [Methanothermobacter sp.]|nr:chromosome segregation protein SMC [Methanothermobacter sp.]
LICDEKYVDVLEPIQELASRGQHVLTRREILNYVTADAGTRAKQIQNLLKINEVEVTRKKLRKVLNSLKKDSQNAESNLNNSKAHINSTVDVETFNEDVILNFVNENRQILGAEALDKLDSATVKEGVKSPALVADDNINLELLEKDLENLQDADFHEETGLLQSEYLELHDKLMSDTTSPKDRLQLTQLGLKLTSDTCPLCDTPWDPEQLQNHLEDKLEHLKGVERDLERMQELSGNISRAIKNKLSSLAQVIKDSSVLGLDQEVGVLKVYKDDLTTIDASLDRDEYGGESIPIFTDIGEVAGKIFQVTVDRYGEPSPEQTAWDKLNRLEENLKYYEENLIQHEKAKNALQNAEILHDAFIKSRDQVLDSLYAEVRDRFVELYRQLHGADEADFDADLVSEGAGVDFKVKFHGEGKHPPHALHSEGHQDSMGICLYLALAERLTQGYIDLIILDDVMMSVDAPHRRQICHLLADFFKGKQFFITTHDQTWARQLQSEGVIKSKNRVELSNWTIQDGPRINYMGDIWGPIKKI